MTFNDAVEIIIESEGGTVDDPTDPGQLTRYGISHRSYPTLDIANLTKDAARQIYRADFWDKCQCENLPKGLDLMVFDSAVNQGPWAAVKLLQRSVGVHEDGVIGPDTIKASQKPDVLAEFVTNRMLHYVENPLFARDGHGWTRRVMRTLVLASRDT